MIGLGSQKIKKTYVGDSKVKKMYLGNIKVYSSGGVVTYQVDSGVSYTEEVDEGADVLHPSSFTPSKPGYTFLGWRENAAASAYVLTNKTMQDETLTLYAVFQRSFTLTLYNGSAAASQSYHSQYYNNGNVYNPSVSLVQSAVSGWSPIGWTTGASGYSISVANGGSVTLTGNATYYGCYNRTVTVSYNSNGGSGDMSVSTGTAYLHSLVGYTNANITLAANEFTRSSYKFTEWALNSASGTKYAPGAVLSIRDDATMYALWTWANMPPFIADKWTGRRANEHSYYEVTSSYAWVSATGYPQGGDSGSADLTGVFEAVTASRVTITGNWNCGHRWGGYSEIELKVGETSVVDISREDSDSDTFSETIDLTSGSDLTIFMRASAEGGYGEWAQNADAEIRITSITFE